MMEMKNKISVLFPTIRNGVRVLNLSMDHVPVSIKVFGVHRCIQLEVALLIPQQTFFKESLDGFLKKTYRPC